MTTHYAIIRCVALVQFDGAPVEPCATCARSFHVKPCGIGTPWMTIPPAFWNGERYVCEHHIEVKNGQ